MLFNIRKASDALQARLSRAQVRLCIAALATVTGLCVAAVAALATGGVFHAATSGVREVVSREGVALMPAHSEAGEGGWCLTTPRGNPGGEGDCPTYMYALPSREGPFAGPIVAEVWSGHGTGPSHADEVLVLTTSEVAAVAIEGYKPVATHPSSLLPDHLRGVLIELRAKSPLPASHLKALNRNGAVIAQTFAAGAPLEFRVPSSSWSQGSHSPAAGVCRLNAKGIARLSFAEGSVMTEVRPHADVRGREFVDCVRSTYLLDNWPAVLEANVLLDAAHPGSKPAALPAMRPLRGHRGIFVGPETKDEELAQRVQGAWLLVAGGKGFTQRLTLLEHLSATLHVG